MRYEDLILRLRCRLEFLRTVMTQAGDDTSEKPDDYWWGLSYVLDDIYDQVAILKSAPWPLQTWDTGDDADAFLADVAQQQKRKLQKAGVHDDPQDSSHEEDKGRTL